jgi:glucose/arabinose dehydrogenase
VALTLDPVVELDAPTAMADRPGDEEALYIAERGGRVVRVVDGAVDGAPVLDISDQTTSDGERGLLGIDFSDDGSRLYVSYTDPNGDSHLDEYRMAGNRADTGTQRTLLEVAQPYSNHNGGNVVTGPDGLLYFGLGDGGAAGDPHNHGQDRSTLLGDLLRIDPRPGDDAAYRIPDDNPFVGGSDARPEIWVSGLRNPWRFSFDRATDDLWIADVGQSAAEEIDHLPFDEAGGTNLGWRVFEGTQRYTDGDADEAVPPVYEYPHDGRCSITGGYLYRGAEIDGLAGTYLYGDFCDGVVRAIVLDGNEVVDERVFDAQVPELVSFGEDASGELYALSLSGPVYRLAAAN